MRMRRALPKLTLLALVLFLGGAIANADPLVGSIFLTGHDPDFHAFEGGNGSGAAHITNSAINFITDPLFNTFAAGGIHKFLYVTSNITPPAGHIDGTLGIEAAGYTLGTDFDRADASTLVSALGQLGTTYDALVVASDFGGILTQAELDILDAHSSAIISFLNQGGGVYAMAESDSGAGLTPNGGFFGYLPFVVSSAQKNQNEVGNTLTPFGAGLGLTAGDVNGNASHNIFTGTGGLDVVDFDSSGQILTIAGRGQVTDHGVVPEPSSVILIGTALLALLLVRRRQNSLARSQS
jgi:PEP-CTERM motif-containing protein